MRTRRMSRDDFHPRVCSGQRSFKGSKKKKNPENVVVIDVDGDDQPDVVIIDVPELLQQNFRGSGVHRRKRSVAHYKVISIDDDESDVDNPNFADPGVSELDSDATSSKTSFPSPDISGSHADSWDQYHDVHEGPSSSKFPARGNSHHGKAPCRNRYGLSPESEYDSSGSDCSDCEVLEGSSEELREQWEKVYSKRKRESLNCRYGTINQASASTSHAGARNKTRVNFRNPFCPRDPVYWFSTYDNFEERSSHVNNENPNIWDNVEAGGKGTFQPNQENDQMERQDQFAPIHGNGQVGEETFADKSQAHPQHRVSSTNNVDVEGEEKDPEDAFGCSNVMRGDKPFDFMGENSGQEEERNVELFCSVSPLSTSCDEDPVLYRTEVPDLNIPECSMQDDAEMKFKTKISRNCSPKEMCSRRAARYEEELGDRPVKKARLPDEREATRNGTEKRKFVRKSTGKIPLDKHKGEEGQPEHPMERSEPHPDEEIGSECSPIMQDSIINGREKLKETDEYRLAQEEEWASRQKLLQQQAEEAQRLRRRRKAERRILDMEKRQKQRVEEMRNTQKKDEENMSLKEQLRAEIRNELSKLEISCIDMPSLLRGLGINLGSSPLPPEVHTAYKQAVLRFHPDRASRSDIRQQVEAEEKFKLISRMKEKFLVTSCH